MDAHTKPSTLQNITSTSVPFVLCACNTWSAIFREEQQDLIFDNRVLRRIQGLKQQDTKRWRELGSAARRQELAVTSSCDIYTVYGRYGAMHK